MSRIMCTATPRVKPTRKSQSPATRFGQGILRYVPSVAPAPYSAAEVEWLNQNPTTAEDRHYDALAFEAMATRHLEMGLCF